MKKALGIYIFAASTILATSVYSDGHVAEGEKLAAKRCKACHTISDGDNVIRRRAKANSHKADKANFRQ